ncbi:YadA-like family protein [Neisseria sicca]|uniref:YadA-like family protein n=1 Tax=Neisseria sicca TaxID=490 RepID=UPI002D77084B|nr:YadA-like family protein [Neisseria sicca]
MKKFNVKVLSMAVTAAVASGAAGAAEQNFAAAVGGKDDQGQAAFFTVFGEGTTYDKGTGKLTFKKDSDALLLKTLELEQTINGFASGSNFITTDANGNKTVREATNEDIEADSLKGVGLAGGLTAVNARVDDVNARVDDLLDDTEAALDEQEKAIEKLNNATKTNIDQITKITEGVNTLNTSVAEMGKDISTKFDEVDSEISKASSELSESIEKVSEDVTAVNTRVDSLAQDTADAKAAAKAAEDKVTELSANVDSKVKEAKDAADKAVDAASKIDAVADKADKASKGVAGLTEALEKVAEQSALAAAENTQALNGFAEGHEIVVTDADGIKSVKKATKEDVEQDEFGGLGLKEVVAQHDQSLADLTAETERAKKAAEQAAFAAIENAQELNGFKEKDEIIVTDDNGVKSVKTATNEDVEADEFKGLGLKEVVAAHDEALGDLTETVNENSEALVKTAEVVNTISADVNANKAALEEQKEANEGFNNAIASLDKDIGDLASAGKAAMEALEVNRQDIDANKTAIETKADKADFEELAKYTADMGKKVNDIGDEVTALSDATNAAITRHDKDIVDLAQAGLKATEALEANRKDIDANKAAIAENTAKLEEQKEANEGFNNAIASLDKDIGDLASAGKAAMEALEVNRQDIDANKAAIETKADKADFEELAKYTADMGKKVNDIGDEVTALSDATSAAITRHDKDIVDLAQAGLKATEALEANRKDIDANKQGIVDLAKGLQLAAEAVEDNRKEIDANKAAIETKADKADFEELAKYTDNMGKKVNDIGDEVTALSDATNAAITRHDKDIVDLAQAGLKATEALEANRKDIDANKQGIVDLAKGLQLAAEAVEDNRKEIDANKTAIAENTAKLEEQKEANDGFNNAIASLDEDIITLKKADLAAADALKAHRTDIDANKAAIETKADKTAVESVRTIAVEAQKSAQVAKGAVEVAQKSAETADSHAKAAQTAAAKAQESADTNAVQIAANTKQIDTNKTDIAALQTANGQHAAGIAKNSARIDSLDKNVANLRKETRQGLAAQAALSGLFQPYSVGKFNVTAALGGFKSDTAVAVGAGYRFNENFAAKAGLAVGTSSGGSASYNVGLNYEW